MEWEGWFGYRLPQYFGGRRREHFSQLFNAIGVSDVRQAETQTAQPLVPEPSAFEVDLPIEKLKSHRSRGIDQIPAESIKAGGWKIRSEINKFINSIWNKEKLPLEWKETIFEGRWDIIVITEALHFGQLRKNVMQHPALKVNSTWSGNY